MSKEKRQLTAAEYIWLEKLEKLIFESPSDLVGFFSVSKGVSVYDPLQFKNFKASKINDAFPLEKSMVSHKNDEGLLYETASTSASQLHIECVSNFIIEKMKSGGTLTNPGLGWRLDYLHVSSNKSLDINDSIIQNLTRIGAIGISMRHATIVATLS